MSEQIAELNEKDFDEGIKSGVTLVDFWAPWCGPCQMMGPILETVATKVADKAKIVKVNVDDNNALAGKFGIQSIPTLIVFKNGVEAKRFMGVQNEDDLVSALEAEA